MAKEIATRTSLSVLVLERGGPFRGLAFYADEMDETNLTRGSLPSCEKCG